MGKERKGNASYSRRELLSKAPVAAAAAVVLGMVSGRPLLSRLVRRRKPPVFPEGSIFTPADDTRDRT